MLAGLALGFGIIISSMTTKYRDLQVLFSFVVQLWMYATPIVYPLSRVAGKQKWGFDVVDIMCINPVTPVIETFKYGALSAGEFVGWGWLAYSFGFMLVVLALGILIFNRVQKSFMDTV
jgi:lipopolysaccharide transport system permease protein